MLRAFGVLAHCVALLAFLCAMRLAHGQIPQEYVAHLPASRARIVYKVDDSRLTVLKGNTHPLATAVNDRGLVLPDQPMHRMLMLLRRSSEQVLALGELLKAQEDPDRRSSING
jgi:hypothetical protein